LEIVCIARYQGFESLPLRKLFRKHRASNARWGEFGGSAAEEGTGKSPGGDARLEIVCIARYQGFESLPLRKLF